MIVGFTGGGQAMAGWWSKGCEGSGSRQTRARAAAASSPGPRRSAPRSEIDEALADREAQAIVAEMRAVRRSAAPAMSPAQVKALAARVSAKAYALIVRHETGGRPYFEKVYKGRAVWPEASSGRHHRLRLRSRLPGQRGRVRRRLERRAGRSPPRYPQDSGRAQGDGSGARRARSSTSARSSTAATSRVCGSRGRLPSGCSAT